MIVFGGLNGIEAAIEADEKLKANKIEQIFKYFCESDRNVNIYGSRSVRLEVNFFNLRHNFIRKFIFFSKGSDFN